MSQKPSSRERRRRKILLTVISLVVLAAVVLSVALSRTIEVRSDDAGDSNQDITTAESSSEASATIAEAETVTVPDTLSGDEAKYAASCDVYTYDEMLGDAETLEGERAAIQGTVAAILKDHILLLVDGDDDRTVSIAVSGASWVSPESGEDDVMGPSAVKVGDTLTVFGTLSGTYETPTETIDSVYTFPQLSAAYILAESE